MSALAQTTVALREGARDARRAWGSLQWAAVALVAAFAVLPWLGLGFVRVDELAAWFYLALAATGLALCVVSRAPSLGRGVRGHRARSRPPCWQRGRAGRDGGATGGAGVSSSSP
jgi:hypothetical protein